jgi:S-adenosylmethionine/arginine decarboxylase-like enzyme
MFSSFERHLSTSVQNNVKVGKRLFHNPKKTEVQSWGLHLIIDAKNCNSKAIRSSTTIQKFSNELVQAIKMKKYGEPQIILFGEGNKKGYTLVQLIETSNICAHFCEESNAMFFDLFSCKYFSKPLVEKLVHNYFQPEAIKSSVRKRDADSLR